MNIEEAKELVDNIETQKPEIPQYIADWYEENKEGLWETVIDLIRVDERLMYKHANPPEKPTKKDKKFLEWLFIEDDAFEILSDMHKFGYTAQKEKLYTVEIPDPNCNENVVILSRNLSGYISIAIANNEGWRDRKAHQLTEQEIRKDFDWAWQWAEEV